MGSYGSHSAQQPEPDDPELTPEQEQEVIQLQRRDREVRAHEAAHAAAAGPAGGGTSFSYTTGPDGHPYATSGEVAVQLARGGSPEETIRNAQRVRSAALAPADPSAQDRAVASAAVAMESQARSEAIAAKATFVRQDVVSSTTTVSLSMFGRRTEGEPDIRSTDPDLDAARLSNERRVAFGERGHFHSPDGCGLCLKASARYARVQSNA